MRTLLLLPLLALLPRAALAAPAAPQVQWFESPEEALGPLLSQKPRVIALGEYHQTRKTTAIRSSLRHFVDDMLPHMLYWPTDLIVETWVTQGNCGTQEKAVVKDVKKTTKRPRKTEDEIVTLIKKASETGIKPHILEFSCAEYNSLLDTQGQVDYEKMLTLLTQQLHKKVTEVSKQRAESGRPILVYGGALHNDLYPQEELKDYTFGPQLLRETGGKYLEVDLYVPEFVKDDPNITKEPWYALYQKQAQAPGNARKTALVRRGPNSYIVLFAKTAR